MAPEVLSEKMNHEDFEAYKRADIYSFSLVMWETTLCAIKDGKWRTNIVKYLFSVLCMNHNTNASAFHFQYLFEFVNAIY